MAKLFGYDCYIRRIVENGKPIFPEAIVLTEDERVAIVNQAQAQIEELAKTRPEGWQADIGNLENQKKIESVERLKRDNRSKFFAQYNNDPLDEENLEFKRDWFQKFVPSPELSEKLNKTGVIISIDPAFRLNQYNDFTGICVTKTTEDNNVYVLEAKAMKLNPDQLVNEIFRLVDKYQNIKAFLLETVTAQIMLLNLLQQEMKKRNKFFVITEVKPESNERKTVHIRSLIPHYANRRIFHAPAMHELEEQLLEFPKGSHDDIIDSLAYQVKFWTSTQSATMRPQAPEGSYEWWHRKIHKKPMQLGKLFRDIRRG